MWASALRGQFAPAAAGAADDNVQSGRINGELFIVEGESAFHAVQAVRNKQTQAVLAMQGKPLNVTKHERKVVKAHPLFMGLAQELFGHADATHVTAPRYDKVVLLFDPDADGIHAGALMLLYFWHFARELIETSRVLVVRAPVGEVNINDALFYPTFVPEFFELCQRAKTAGQVPRARRYRGVGSIPPALLSHFCVEPETRTAHAADAALAKQAHALFGEANGQAEMPW